MSVKPSTLPRWATDLTNNTAPSSGQMDTGWEPEQDGVSDYDNWKSYWAYKWLEWLSESQLNDGTADYSLTANVANADLTGTGDLDNIHTVYVTPDDDWELDGIQYGVDKQEIQLVNIGSEFFWLAHEAPGATAINRITMPAHWVSTTNGEFIHVLPGGSVKLRYHGASSRWLLIDARGIRRMQRLSLPASIIETTSGSDATISAGGSEVISNTAVVSAFYPIPLPYDSMIAGFKAYIEKNSDNTKTMAARFYKQEAATGTETNVSGTQSNTANAPGRTYLPSSDPLSIFSPELTVDGYQYYIYASTTSDTGVDGFVHCIVYAWVPE
jgi:hypothetical protein